MPKTLIHRLSLLLFCFICFISNSKGYYDVYSIKNGLSSNIIHSLYEDSKGIVWIGTGYGLNKFDGQNFRVFIDDNSGNSILGNTVLSICEKTGDKLWVGTDKALCALDRKTGSWKTYQITNGLDLFCMRIVTFGNKLLIFTSNNGLFLFNPDTENFIQLDAAQAKHITPLSQTRCLYYHAGTLTYIEINHTGKIEKYSHQVTNIPINNIQGITCKSGNEFEFISENVIYSYTINKGITLTKVQSFSVGLIIFVFNNKTLVLYNELNDLRITDTLGYHIIQMPRITDQPTMVYSLVRGKNNLLLGTDKGLFRIRNTQSHMHFINHERGLKYDYVRSILNYDSTRLLIGTKNGYLTVIHDFENILYNKKPNISIHKYLNKGSSDNLSANCLYKLKTGEVLIGTTNDGLYILDEDLVGDAHKIITESASLNNGSIWALLEDQNHIWIGTLSNGLFRYDKISGKVTNYGLTSPGNHEIYFLHKWNNTLYLGTSNGLWKTETNGSHLLFDRIKAIPEYCHVWKILNYTENSLIFITTNCGLYRYDIETGIQHNITIDDTVGLSSNTLCGIIPNGDESFFISSRNGLNILSRDFSKNSIINFTKGWADNNYNFNATETFREHWLLFGTATGLVLIDKDRIYNKPEIAPYIGGFKIFDQTKYIELSSGDTVSLSSEENFFSFEFSLIDQMPFGKHFSYMLEGVDKSWRTTTENIASYTGLNPGNYRFLLKSENPLITTGKDDAVFIHVVIVPEFYQTLLFKIAIVMCALGILAFMIYAQLKKNSFKARMTEVESKLLRLQMNPHFMFNCLTSIQHYIMREDKRKAMKYLAKFSRLIRIMLNNSKREFIPLTEEMIFLTTYLELEGLRMDDFDYSIELNKGISEHIQIPSMVLQPFIENAVKHGLLNKKGKKRLIISFNRLNTTTLQCHIIDNGIGIVRAQEIKSKTDSSHDSFGLELTKNRLKIFKTMQKKNYDFEIYDSKDTGSFNSGTTVVLTMEVL